MGKEFKKEIQNLLFKEAALSSMNLGVGLTFLRKYNFAQLGFIYQAFFSLSVGIERLIKLMILYEYIYNNDNYPPKNFLKSKGHDIEKLFEEAKILAKKYSQEHLIDKIEKCEISSKIIKNLSDFAKVNRYFQLDKLSGSNNTEDPIARWDREINSLIVMKHFNPNTKNNRAMIEISKHMDGFAMFRHTDEQDREINDAQDFIYNSISSVTKQKYGMFYCYKIINGLCELQRSQNSHLHSNAYLYEFYMIFRMDFKDALQKKSWNPHSPYKF
ncbi:MAG: hypothetical protein H6568_06605 [Lewinellaceae bacterium]|nr:hypothetical protein [Lewinellaceae bacterium]